MKSSMQPGRRDHLRGKGRARGRQAVDLRLERCEERVLLASFTVTDFNDNANPGTLRTALTQLALSTDPTNTIDFQIGSIGSLNTITLGSNLPVIDRPVTIDAYTNGATANTSAIGTNATILVQLNLNGNAGLIFNPGSSGSRVQGLSIYGGSGAAIALNTANVTVAGNFLGLQADGATASPNATGVSVAATVASATIGTAAAADRNLIAGNTGASDGSGVLAAGNGVIVRNNLIGTDRTGLLARPNLTGVKVTGTSATPGGTATVSQNLIAGNSGQGVWLNGATNVIVQGNRIGQRSDAAGSLANGSDGVRLDNAAANNTIGASGLGNLIAGNAGFGVNLVAGAGAHDNLIVANTVGLDSLGIPRPNLLGGLAVDGTANTVGGATAALRNVIAGNAVAGLLLGSNARVLGNFIGVGLAGTVVAGATQPFGVLATGVGNQIGGAALGEGNLIAGNTLAGVRLQGGSGTTVAGNIIGLDANGAAAGNGGRGVLLDSGSSGNTIGGTLANAGNVIAGQTAGVGVELSTAGGGSTDNNVVAGNLIGLDPSGVARPNLRGVVIVGLNNRVGGNTALARNVISGNAGDALTINGNLTLVQNNLIGLAADGVSARPNSGDGVTIAGANNSIGGTAVNTPNTIAFNTGAGVRVTSGTGNAIRQNAIYANGPAGIVLAGGGNAGQPAPIVTGATSVTNLTAVSFTLGATPLAPGDYIVDFFASSPGDPASPAQAHVFLGSLTVTYAGPGVQAYTAQLNVASAVPAGQSITATATSVGGQNTSALANSRPLAANSFVVTNTADSGVGSLRQAILNANANPGADAITFAILAAPNVINPATPLPPITERVSIDGTTEPGYVGLPLIEIRGTAGLGDGLVLAAPSGGSTIKGLDIYGFSAGAGILVQSAGNALQNNFLGTNAAGTAAGPGNLVGILIDNVANTIVGGLARVGNLISGNASGVVVQGPAATGNQIQGNQIGTNLQGNGAVANSLGGVRILAGASNNLVGSTTPGLGNVIAFNGGFGVTIDTGTGNAIRQNSIYANASGGISLVNNGNLNQPSPTITSVNSTSLNTTIQGTLSGFAPNASFALDFFASVLGDPLTPDQAHLFLGSTPAPVTTDGAGNANFSVTFTGSLPVGQFVTATATSAANNTSRLATARQVANPFLVTNTADSGVGSLRQAILNANATPGLDPVSFAITTSAPHLINLLSALPLITDPILIDATTQTGYSGTPLVQLVGNASLGNGIELAAASGGSTIKGLDIYGFSAGAGIFVGSAGNFIQSNFLGANVSGTAAGPGNQFGVVVNNVSNTTVGGLTASGNLISGNTVGVELRGAAASGNLIQGNRIGTNAAGNAAVANTLGGVRILAGLNNLVGGTTPGLGNVIAFNGGFGVTVDTGTGNAIRQNSIYANVSGGISLVNNGNLNQPAPTLTNATSDATSTTIAGNLAGFAPNTTFALDFFASSPADPVGPDRARVFLGSRSFTTDGSGNAPISVTFATPVINGQVVTATATSPVNNTSRFAAARLVGNPLVVTTTADNGDNLNPIPGSLRAAINGANANLGPDVITFAITTAAPLVINLAGTPLPSIVDPVLIDGLSSTSLVTINGSAIPGAPAGLTLAAGSSGSTIRGLGVTGFGGAGIRVDTSTRNVLTQNLIFSNGGPGIVLVNGGNNGQAAPAINAVASTGTTSLTTIELATTGLAVAQTLEFFASMTNGTVVPAPRFLGSFLISAIPSGSLIVSLPTSVGVGELVTATLTSPPSGTSAFATGRSVVTPFVVTTNADDGVGSLRQAINAANADPGADTITFAGSFVITTASPLPTITRPVQINGAGTNQIVAGGSIPFGLELGSGSQTSTLTGLQVSGFSTAGFRLLSSNNTLTANTISQNTIGVLIDGSAGNTIGGVTAGAGNTIVRNTQEGVLIQGGATNNRLQGNFIGTDALGAALGNGVGVRVLNSSGNAIGADGASVPPLAGAGNTIGFNVSAGVTISSGVNNVIRGNIYRATNGPAAFPPVSDITLGSGANNNQVAPSLSNASVNGSQLTVRYSTPASATAGSVVDFYQVFAAAPVRRVFLGSSTNLGSDQIATLPNLAPGAVLVATVTVPANGTSAFSGSVTTADRFTVTTTTDNGSNTNPTPGSLRAAIVAANLQAGPVCTRISFNVQSDTSSFFVVIQVNPSNPLPTITKQVVLDGTTQFGYASGATGLPGAPLVQIDGGFQPFGLVLGAGSDGSVIQGLNIVRTTAAGILINGSNSNTVAGTWVGVSAFNPLDPRFVGNFVGIRVQNADGNTIGLPKLKIYDANCNPIGDSSFNGRNVLSGNDSDGLQIEGNSLAPTGNTVQNTYIGTDFFGNLITDQNTGFNLYNVGNGIRVRNSAGNKLGQLPAGATVNDTLNVISGNFQDGIRIEGPGATGNSVVNTFIGTESAGQSSSPFMGNLGDGVHILDAGPNQVGMAASPTQPFFGRNLISGNFGNGVHIENSTGVTVVNNLIGTDSTGLFSNTTLANSLNGVLIDGDSSGNVVGTALNGPSAVMGSANLISGNLKAGVRIDGGRGGNAISGNFIGTTITGNSDIGNGADGVDVLNSPANTIGGANPGLANTITGNNGNGVYVTGTYAAGQGNQVLGNILGARTAASQTNGNAFNGVALVNSTNNVIGGTTAASRNIITGNGFGSFARTQLTGANRTPNSNSTRSYFTDSFTSVAAGSFAEQTSYLALLSEVFNQQRTVPGGPPAFASTGDFQLALAQTDATGTVVPDVINPFGSVVSTPDRVNLARLAQLPSLPTGQAYTYAAVSTGNFLNSPAAGATTQREVIVYVYATASNGPVAGSGRVLIFPVSTVGNRLVFTNPSNPTVVSLAGTPSTSAVFSVFRLPGLDHDGFAVVQAGGSVLAVFDPRAGGNAIQTIAGFQSIADVVAANFNQDSSVDLAIADSQSQTVKIFLGNATGGTFSPTPPANDISITGVTPNSLGAGALRRGNPNVDLVIVDRALGNAYTIFGNGDGTFRLTPVPNPNPVGVSPGRVAVADFEGTGVASVAVLDRGDSASATPVPGQVTLLSNNGDGTFRTPTRFDVGLNPTGLTIQTIPGLTSPSLATSNAFPLVGGGQPVQLQFNLRQLSTQRSNGIAVTGVLSGANTIQGNSIGLDIQSDQTQPNANDGGQARPNANDGVLIVRDANNAQAGNIIGGLVPGARNVISGNNGDGVHLMGSPRPVPVDMIVGNIIGLDATGTTSVDSLGRPLGNSKHGVELEGLAATIRGNTISGNGISGIQVGNSTAGLQESVPATIVGNTIGLNIDGDRAYTVDGLTPLGNVLNGISVDRVTGVIIGGASSADANLIAGNLGRGIQIIGANGRNSIYSNLIGLGREKNPNNNPGTNAPILPIPVGSPVGAQFVGGATGPVRQISLGNLSEGIFLLDDSATFIGPLGTGGAAPVVSNNRGFGIHAVRSTNLTIQGTSIGTDPTGLLTVLTVPPRNPQLTGSVPIGNSSDGIFLDQVKGVGTTGHGADIIGNVISGNAASGIHLLESSEVFVTGNKIGTDKNGTFTTDANGAPLLVGNSGSGIFINQSGNNTIGGATPTAGQGLGNLISGNQFNGILVSRNHPTLKDPVNATLPLGNTIQGNVVGLSGDGLRANPNAVVGILVTASSNNLIGGTGDGERNVVSGNRLYGILIAGSLGQGVVPGRVGEALVAGDATANVVKGNRIGTDSAGMRALGNSADGVFILNAHDNTIGGPETGGRNVIAANAANGVRIFGVQSVRNVVDGNYIGVGADGLTSLGNAANGVLLDNAGPTGPPDRTRNTANIVGSLASVRAGNVISGNSQSGVLLISTGDGGNQVVGNRIGTDATGTIDVGNRAYGVFVFSSSFNTINANLISGNDQSGVFIFSSGGATGNSTENHVFSNFVGTDTTGLKRLGNGGSGIQIVNSGRNTIGNVSQVNVVSGNAANGIEIDSLGLVPASNNLVAGNYVGVGRDGVTALGNRQNGVLVINAKDNFIGQPRPDAALIPDTNVLDKPSNVIAANTISGIQLTGTAARTTIQANYLGVDVNGTFRSGLAQPIGVYVNDTGKDASEARIGSATVRGAGNMIAGDRDSIGIEIFGPVTTNVMSKNVVSGNLIGLDKSGAPRQASAVAGARGVGVRINSSRGNVIGRAQDQSGGKYRGDNVISGNGLAGVQIVGLISTANTIRGNFIGTDVRGNAVYPPAPIPANPILAQVYGVQVLDATGNTVGDTNAGLTAPRATNLAANVISGNSTGVNILNAGPNTIRGNLIGTDPSGTRAAGNFQFGVVVSNSPSPVVTANLASTNGIAGVELIDLGVRGGDVSNNFVGTDINGRLAFPRPSGPSVSTSNGPVFLGAQKHGVVLIGTARNGNPSNTIAGNTIAGNFEVGVYITNKDFTGRVYNAPVNTRVENNTIRNNGIYGVLFFDAPNNIAPPFTGAGRRNTVTGNPFPFLNFLSRVNGRGRTTLPIPTPTVRGQSQSQNQVQAQASTTSAAPKAARPVRVVMDRWKLR